MPSEACKNISKAVEDGLTAGGEYYYDTLARSDAVFVNLFWRPKGLRPKFSEAVGEAALIAAAEACALNK